MFVLHSIAVPIEMVSGGREDWSAYGMLCKLDGLAKLLMLGGFGGAVNMKSVTVHVWVPISTYLTLFPFSVEEIDDKRTCVYFSLQSIRFYN